MQTTSPNPDNAGAREASPVWHIIRKWGCFVPATLNGGSIHLPASRPNGFLSEYEAREWMRANYDWREE